MIDKKIYGIIPKEKIEKKIDEILKEIPKYPYNCVYLDYHANEVLKKEKDVKTLIAYGMIYEDYYKLKKAVRFFKKSIQILIEKLNFYKTPEQREEWRKRWENKEYLFVETLRDVVNEEKKKLY